MPTLDEFFRTPQDSLPHPRLRNWKARLDQPGTSATLEVSRPDTALGQSRPEMNVQFTAGRDLLPLETVPWDDDLNAGLIQLRVKAVSAEQEAERFALGLRAALRKAEQEFGDGYFNAVLLEFLAESDLTQHEVIADVLKHAHANSPSRRGNSYELCRQMIGDAISRRAQELTGALGYPQDDAKRILVLALAKYLDQRFSVTTRRQFGWL